MNIRMAAAADSEALRDIYGQYIDTPVTFECTLPGKEEFRRRVLEVLARYPYLVWEEDSRILGYSYAHRQMEREAYQWNAELSIYLHKEHTSKGMGKRLYGALTELLKLQGVKTLYGGVTIPNEKSEGLHKSLGFQVIGVHHNTGYKCGRWHDVVWYEKAILPYEDSPAPIVPVGEIPQQKIDEILKRFSAFSHLESVKQ